jgi:hypothetical protein
LVRKIANGIHSKEKLQLSSKNYSRRQKHPLCNILQPFRGSAMGKAN